MPRLLGEQPQRGALGNEAVDGDRSLAPLLWDEHGSSSDTTVAKQRPRTLLGRQYVNWENSKLVATGCFFLFFCVYISELIPECEIIEGDV